MKNAPFLPVILINAPSYVSYLHWFSLLLSEIFPTSKFLLQVKREYVVVNTSKKQATKNGDSKSPTVMTTCLVRVGFEISLFVLDAMKMDIRRVALVSMS